jgi:hypothetical protein
MDLISRVTGDSQLTTVPRGTLTRPVCPPCTVIAIVRMGTVDRAELSATPVAMFELGAGEVTDDVRRSRAHYLISVDVGYTAMGPPVRQASLSFGLQMG